MAIIDYRAELTRAGANVEGRWSALRFLMRRYPLGAFGAVIMAVCVFAALFAPYITVYDPLSTNSAFSLARPSAQHWLGCDFMGRDVYSRIVYGSRISLAVGIGSLSLGLTCGVLIGLTSGYLGGWIDLAAQRLIDILQSLPLLVMALLMTASLGPSLRNTNIANSIQLIPSSGNVKRCMHLKTNSDQVVDRTESPAYAMTKVAEQAGTAIDIKGLQTYLFTRSGIVKAVDDVSFSLRRGETLAIVGESGCGKSMTALSIMRLVPNPPGKIVGGTIMLEGRDLLKRGEAQMRDIRGNDISMIFQEPMTSLNPVLTIGHQIGEALRLHQDLSKTAAAEKAVEMLR